MCHRKTKTILSLFLCLILAASVFPIPANADMGPKPWIYIQFENIGDSPCYGAILSPFADPIMYPDFYYFEDPVLTENLISIFEGYSDPDGYHYVGDLWKLNQAPSMQWDYMPPDSFKLLLYYPEANTFVASDIIEKKEFRAYYTVDLAGMNIHSVVFEEDKSVDEESLYEEALAVERASNWEWEILSFVLRVISTILIETVIAWLFGFREKKQLLLLAVTNITTQILLNAFLNRAYYTSHLFTPVFFYIFAIIYLLYELVVFASEAVCYCLFMNRLSNKRRKKSFYVLYAFVANAVSFGVGLIVVKLSSNMP